MGEERRRNCQNWLSESRRSQKQHRHQYSAQRCSRSNWSVGTKVWGPQLDIYKLWQNYCDAWDGACGVRESAWYERPPWLLYDQLGRYKNCSRLRNRADGWSVRGSWLNYWNNGIGDAVRWRLRRETFCDENRESTGCRWSSSKRQGRALFSIARLQR